MTRRSVRTPLGLTALLMFPAITLSACSDDGGSPGFSSGIVSVSSGRVQDSSGLVVNGRQFDDGSTLVLVDGEPAPREAIAPGMRVTVESRAGEPAVVRYDAEVKGPLDSVFSPGSFSVMGQRVIASADTRFDDALDGSALIAGDIVEVSGARGADDAIEAGYVELKRQPPNAYQIHGIVRDLDVAARTFRLDQLTVDYGGARLEDIDPARLANGQRVEVKDENLTYEPGSLFLQATKVEAESGADRSEDARTEFEIEAIITSIESADRFILGTLPVRIVAATRFRDGSAADLIVGARVEVEGRRDDAGDLIAREIEFEDRDSDDDDDDDDDDDR